eukprot:COSAG06_NODE_5204_length_3641_cov_61.025936_1_plen_409_part_00
MQPVEPVPEPESEVKRRYSPKHTWSPPWLSPDNKGGDRGGSPTEQQQQRSPTAVAEVGLGSPVRRLGLTPLASTKTEPEPEPQVQPQPEPQLQPEPQPQLTPQKKPSWAKGRTRSRTFTLHVQPNPYVPSDDVTVLQIEAQSLSALQAATAQGLGMTGADMDVLLCPAVESLVDAAPLRALAELGSEEAVSVYPTRCFEGDGITPILDAEPEPEPATAEPEPEPEPERVSMFSAEGLDLLRPTPQQQQQQQQEPTSRGYSSSSERGRSERGDTGQTYSAELSAAPQAVMLTVPTPQPQPPESESEPEPEPEPETLDKISSIFRWGVRHQQRAKQQQEYAEGAGEGVLLLERIGMSSISEVLGTGELEEEDWEEWCGRAGADHTIGLTVGMHSPSTVLYCTVLYLLDLE